MPIDPKELISTDRIVDLDTGRKDEVLNKLIEKLSSAPQVTNADELRAKIFEREKTASTGVGEGIAIPHVKIASITDFVAAVGLSKQGIDFDSLDKKPTHIVVMIGCNNRQAGDFLKVLARLVTKLRSKEMQQRILNAHSHKEVRDIFVSNEGVFV